MTESLTLESGGCFDLLKIGHNQNNDVDSPHPLSIMSAIYPITGALAAEAELGARARARGPRAGGGQDGTQEPPG